VSWGSVTNFISVFLTLFLFVSANADDCQNHGRYIVKFAAKHRTGSLFDARPIKAMVEEKVKVYGQSNVKMAEPERVSINPVFPKESLVQTRRGAALKAVGLNVEPVSSDPYFVFSFIEGTPIDEAEKLLHVLYADQEIVSFEKDCAVFLPNGKKDERSKLLNKSETDPSFGSLWGLQNVRAPLGWKMLSKIAEGRQKGLSYSEIIHEVQQLDSDGSQGEPISSTGFRVGVCDTGATPDHPDLKDNYARDENGVIVAFDTTDREFMAGEPKITDGHGHGTHVAGTIAAQGWNDEGVIGIAPHLKIVSGKTLEDSGIGYGTWIARCIRQMTNLKVKVINLSLGGPASNLTTLEIQRATDNGVTVVFSAGNNGAENVPLNYLARNPNVISVAATEHFGGNPMSYDLAWFSNYGSWVDIAGPGHNILSTVPMTGYYNTSGTSMAAPHIVGLLGTMKNLAPDMEKEDLLRVLRETANEFTSTQDPKGRNYKSIDMPNAILGTLRWLENQQYGISQSLNNRLIGYVSSVEYDESIMHLRISGRAFDRDNLEGIRLKVQVQTADSEAPVDTFTSVQTLLLPPCIGEPMRLNPERARYVPDRSRFVNCTFEVIVPFANRFGAYNVRVLARDVARDGTSEYVPLRTAQDPLRVFLPEYPENKPAVGIVEDFYSTFARRLRLKGYVFDPDAPEAQLFVGVYARIKDDETCPWYEFDGTYASKPRPDLVDQNILPADSPNHGFEVDLYADENYFQRPLDLSIMSVDVTPDIDLYSMLYLRDQETGLIIFDNYERLSYDRDTYRKYENDQGCEVEVYEYQHHVTVWARIENGGYGAAGINKDNKSAFGITNYCEPDRNTGELTSAREDRDGMTWITCDTSYLVTWGSDIDTETLDLTTVHFENHRSSPVNPGPFILDCQNLELVQIGKN
jgi:hypothetical protein